MIYVLLVISGYSYESDWARVVMNIEIHVLLVSGTDGLNQSRKFHFKHMTNLTLKPYIIH